MRMSARIQMPTIPPSSYTEAIASWKEAQMDAHNTTSLCIESIATRQEPPHTNMQRSVPEAMKIDVLRDLVGGSKKSCTTCMLTMKLSNLTLTVLCAMLAPLSPRHQCWMWIWLSNPGTQSGATFLPFGRGVDQEHVWAASDQPQSPQH